jgi:hypothetical protein
MRYSFSEQRLRDALNNVIDSDSLLYSIEEVFTMLGWAPRFSMTGKELIGFIHEKIEDIEIENYLANKDQEVIILEPIKVEATSTPVNNDIVATPVASRNLIKSRYLEGKASSFLSANNLQLNKKIAVKTRDGHRLLSEQSKVLSILEEAGYKHRPSLDKYNRTVDCLISNMVLHSRKNNWTRISLTEGAYTGSDMSYTAIKNLIDALEKSGQIEVIKGFNAKEGFKTGRSTCVRFHDESPLYEYICHQVAKDELRYNLDNKYVVLVRNNHKQVSLVEGDKVPANSVRLFDLYKAAVENTTVSIPSSQTEDPNVTFLPQMEYKNGNKGYDLTQLTPIHQVFNRKDLTTGGRFYCGITNLKKETRGSILFNGRLTTEVDFRACHLSILATMSGAAITKDPYTFGDLTTREINKLFCLIAINSKSIHQMNQALGRKIKDLQLGFSVEDWIASVDAKHPWLSNYFGGNAGLRLQAVESRVVSRAMINFMEKTKSLAISLHDGCLVDRRYAATMVEFMLDSLEEEFPLVPQAIRGQNICVVADGVSYFAHAERKD